MSIVQSLVVNRYKGRVNVRSRPRDDYTKDMTVDIWLRKSTDSPALQSLTLLDGTFETREIKSVFFLIRVESYAARDRFNQLFLAERFP